MLSPLLVECQQWSTARAQYLQGITLRWWDVSYLLGGWYNERKDRPRAQWTSDAKPIRAVIGFVTAMGRLHMEA